MQNGEMAMLAPLVLKPIDLEARTVHRIQNPSGQEVCCVRGLVWVTQAHDARGIMLAAIGGLMGRPQIQEARDIILASGQSVVLDRRGLMVVFAFEDAYSWRTPAAFGNRRGAGETTSQRSIRAIFGLVGLTRRVPSGSKDG
jgi:Protein of unknown function (DUF2917)